MTILDLNDLVEAAGKGQICISDSLTAGLLKAAADALTLLDRIDPVHMIEAVDSNDVIDGDEVINAREDLRAALNEILNNQEPP